MFTKIKIKELTNKEKEIICHSYNCIDGCPFCYILENGESVCIRDEKEYSDIEIEVLTNKLNPKRFSKF